jgi:hypothetical protein
MSKEDIIYDKMFEFDEFYPYQLYKEVNINDYVSKSHFLKILNKLIEHNEIIKIKEVINNKHLICYYSATNSNNQLFTLGYENTKIEDFIGKLKLFGIKGIIDVRENPFSFKKDYSKINLMKILQLHNIKYINYRELGSPKELRQKLHLDNDYKFFFQKYEEYIDTKEKLLNSIIRRVEHENSALLCLEGDINRCHRSIIVKKLKERKSELKIVNI